MSARRDLLRVLARERSEILQIPGLATACMRMVAEARRASGLRSGVSVGTYGLAAPLHQGPRVRRNRAENEMLVYVTTIFHRITTVRLPSGEARRRIAHRAGEWLSTALLVLAAMLVAALVFAPGR